MPTSKLIEIRFVTRTEGERLMRESDGKMERDQWKVAHLPPATCHLYIERRERIRVPNEKGEGRHEPNVRDELREDARQ